MALTLVAFSASATPLTSVGSPDDILYGCDSALKPDPTTWCRLSFDENGNIFGNISTWLTPGTNTLEAFHGPSTVNPAWVDSNGNPVEVTSYYVRAHGDFGQEWLSFDEGTIGFCEFGLEADGTCTNGDDKSDVLIFTNWTTLGDFANHYNRIDFLSDGEARFPFPTAVNILEIGSEGNNYVDFDVLNPEGGGGEDIFYHVVSDGTVGTVPEPSSLMLMGSGLWLLASKIRRKIGS